MPIFQQGAWFDPYSGSHLRSFAGIPAGVPNRVLIGPWSHEEEVETFTGDIDLSPALTVIRDHELEFYDRYLKDVDNGWDERPPAELYVLGANEWRGENEWPLARTQADAVPPPAGRRPLASTSRGSDEQRRPLRLRPRRSGADDRRRQLRAHDDAGRRDADPPGPDRPARARAPRRRARLHERAARRAISRWSARSRWCSTPRRRRATPTSSCGSATSIPTAARSSSPRASSGRATAAASRASPSSCSSRARWPSTGSAATRSRTSSSAGHCIRLDVTSSSFPRFSRNLNTGEDVGTGTRMQVAHQTVLHTSAYPSRVVLPVIPAS